MTINQRNTRSQEQTERKTDDDDHEEEEEEDVEDDDYYDDDFEDEEEDNEDEENVPEVSNVKQLAPPRSGGVQSTKPILFSKSNLGVSRGIRFVFLQSLSLSLHIYMEHT